MTSGAKLALAVVVAYFAGKSSGGFHLFGKREKQPEMGPHLPEHGIDHPDGLVPVSTSTVVPFGQSRPSGLPPFPSGWRPQNPPTHDNIRRAWALLPLMKLGETRYEHGPTDWLAFHAYRDKSSGKKFVSVYEPKAPTSAQVRT